MIKSKGFVLLLVALSTFFWGSNFNAGAIVVSSTSPLIAATERFVIATIFIFIFMLMKEKNNLIAFKNNWLTFIGLGLCGITGFNLAFFIGLQTTSPINGALIMATSPVTTSLLAAIIDKHKISLPQTLGMLLSLIGVILIISQGSIKNLMTLTFSYGDLIIMLGNLAWAIYTVGCRKYISNSTAIQTTSFTILFGTIGITLFSAYYSDLIPEFLAVSSTNHLILIYMGLAGSVLAYLFWNMGIKELGSANTAIFFNLVPVFTMIIATMTGMLPNILQLIGTLLVISGVIYATGAYKIMLKK